MTVSANYTEAAKALLTAAKGGNSSSLDALHSNMTGWKSQTRIELKRELARLGYYNGPVNSIWDRSARSALEDFLKAP